MLNLSSKLKRFSFMTVFTIDHHIKVDRAVEKWFSVCLQQGGDGGLFEKRNLIQFKWWRVNDECKSLHSSWMNEWMIHVLPFLFYTALNNIQTQKFSKVFQWVLFGLVVVLSRPIFVPLCPNVFWQKTEIWHLDQWRQGVKGNKKKYNMSKNETKTINIVINNSKSIT